MEMFHIIINLIALVVNVCLVYFSVKLLSIFKGSTMGRPWLFILCGVLALAIGSSVFSFKYLLSVGSFEVHVAGGLLMLVGGVLALIGIYLEYKNWAISK